MVTHLSGMVVMKAHFAVKNLAPFDYEFMVTICHAYQLMWAGLLAVECVTCGRGCWLWNV